MFPDQSDGDQNHLLRYLTGSIFLTGVFSVLLCVFIDGNYLTFVCKMRSWFPGDSALDGILSNTGAIDSNLIQRKKNTKFDAPVAAKLHHSNQTWSVCGMHTEIETCSLITRDAPLLPEQIR